MQSILQTLALTSVNQNCPPFYFMKRETKLMREGGMMENRIYWVLILYLIVYLSAFLRKAMIGYIEVR
jgi:hypothetical protein